MVSFIVFEVVPQMYLVLTLYSLKDKLLKYINPNILKNIDKIKAQAIDLDIMPPGNLTGITETERMKINNWILQGSPINN